jgi:PhnB protein
LNVKPIPDGYHTVTPYLVVEGALKLIDFLREAFKATEIYRLTRPDGKVGHAEVRIGDSVIMLGDMGGSGNPCLVQFICMYPTQMQLTDRQLMLVPFH